MFDICTPKSSIDSNATFVIFSSCCSDLVTFSSVFSATASSFAASSTAASFSSASALPSVSVLSTVSSFPSMASMASFSSLAAASFYAFYSLRKSSVTLSLSTLTPLAAYDAG